MAVLEQLVTDGGGAHFYAGLTKGGQTFIGWSDIVNSIEFYVGKSGSPSGNLTCDIYSMSGGEPNAVLETSSTVIAISTLPTVPTNAWKKFDFAGDNYDEDICIVLSHSGGTADDHLDAQVSAANEYGGGTTYLYYLGTWVSGSPQDGAFKLTYGVSSGSRRVFNVS